MLAVALAGCGGSGGGGTTAAAPAAGGGAAAAAGGTPAGTAVITAAAANPAATNTADNPAQAFGLIAAAGATPVTVQSPPVVNFTVIDSAGKFVPGLTLVNPAGSAAGLAADPSCSGNNVTFAMAKLNQPTDSSPSTWQNLISRQRLAANAGGKFAVVEGTTDPKPTAAGVKITKADGTTTTGQFANPDTAVKDPSTRIVGILEENTAGGYYTYRFATDVVTPLAMANAVDVKNVSQGKVANNGNVAVKDGKTIHRVGAQLCYTDPVSKAKVVVNPTFDFTLDASGNAVAVKGSDGKTPALYKQVVDKASCNECHSKLTLHGTRVDPNYCVMCHNPGSIDYNTNNPIDLKVMVHRIHMGKELTKDYKVNNLVVKATDPVTGAVTGTGYPQDVKNCVKCHTGTAAAAGSTSGTHATQNGDNWKNVPSRNACGACHDGIDFEHNTGVTLADAAKGLATSATAHVGGAKLNDSQCALCHGAADIPVYHTTVTPIWNAAKTVLSVYAGQKSLPAGAEKFAYQISDVTVGGTPLRTSVTFRILKKDGTPVIFNTFAAGGTALITGFTGGPSIYVAMAIPQDGIGAPADFNKYVNASVQNLWNGTAGTLSAPDANGYYTAVLGGGLPVTTTTYDIPATAVMVTGAMGFGSFTQTMSNTTAYPTGLQVPAQVVQKVATGHAPRRDIVSSDKCKACHEDLGLFTAANFHSGNRNDATACTICHNPNRASSGWSADSTSYIHAIHGSSKRTVNFNWHASSATDGYWQIGYPGVLKNCETCHVAGSYDFSAAKNAAAVSKRLYRTVATGASAAATISTSPYVAQVAGTDYGTGYSTSTGVAGTGIATNLVSSPIAAACFSCHDSVTAQQHMSQDGGGALYEARGTALLKTERCLSCHGTGKLADIKVMHAK